VSTGYPSENIAVIPNSSDNFEFAHNAVAAQQFRCAKEWLGDKPLLVYTGTFGKVNGVDYMVDIARALLARESDVRILLVGSGAERRNVMEAAKESGVYERNLFFEKSLPKKDIATLLSAATMASNLVIDLPQARANSANKFFDTLAAGKPILLNHGGWMHDLVMSHRCGLPAWQKSIDEVADELDIKLHDKVWLEKAGYAARKLAELHFDRDVLADQLLKVLQKAVDGDAEKVATIAPGHYV